MKVDNVRSGTAAKPSTTDKDVGTDAMPATMPAVTYVVDKIGRRLGLKKLKPSQRFSLEDIVQPKSPSTEMQAIFVATVFSIDDEGMTPIASRKDFMERVDQVGDEGLVAIVEPCMKLYGLSLDEKDILTAKNS